MDCYAQFKSTALTWTDVFAFIADGTYKDNLAIGDTVPLDLGSEGVINMEIVAFDTDTKADGSGKAPITWIAKDILATDHQLHSESSLKNKFSMSGLNTYLQETIKPMIPIDVRNAMVSVTKFHATNSSSTYQASENLDLWIPSLRELNILKGSVEVSAPIYSEAYPTSTSANKQRNGQPAPYWSRTAFNDQQYYLIFCYSGGMRETNHNITNLAGIALGFCT
jgi:hypothetical protein